MGLFVSVQFLLFQKVSFLLVPLLLLVFFNYCYMGGNYQGPANQKLGGLIPPICTVKYPQVDA